jgi:hypothetical protein
MKIALLIPLALATLAADINAQTRIFRCGNTYTNNAAEAQANGCKPMEGGNITIVEGTRVQSGNAPVKVATAPQASGPTPKVDVEGQKQRDGEARLILESELKKAEARQAELAKEYNNGEPEKLGPEHRNHQKYVERVAELKASLARTENDIAGIRRELTRVPASK